LRPPHLQLDAAGKRADKFRAKGKEFDFNALLGMEPDGGTTNIRNTSSPHWKRWFGVQNRCVVPFTPFAEPDPSSKVEGGRTPNAWFASTGDDPLMFFAGLWAKDWTSVRKVKDGLVSIDLFAFLTTERYSCTDPSESDGRDTDDEERGRDLARSIVGGSQGIAAPRPDDLLKIEPVMDAVP
jgi:hypothetical protein